MKVTVVQIGARHHYAVPRILAGVDKLAAFYTDALAVKGLGRVLPRLPGLRGHPLVAKLGQRVPVGVPLEKIRQTDALLNRRLRGALRLGTMPRGYLEDDHLFDRITAGWGFAGADTLYAMQKHGTRVLEAARQEGLRVVVDVFITPMAHRILEEERRSYPEIEAPSNDEEALEREDERTRLEIAQADLLLCPGENVVEGLASFPEAVGKAFAVVPYGSGVSFEGRKNQPVRGRILFAGTADLRKGIHYLGMAAEKLAGRGYEFRVAGNVSDKLRSHPLMKNLTFLGRIPRSQMIEEFLTADLFVLPTLAEGCASVVHEAVMAGCPVITTRASGTLVKEGQGGKIVPEREPEALAAAIDALVKDRDERNRLAESCEGLADELSEERWGERLITALEETTPKSIGSATEP